MVGLGEFDEKPCQSFNDDSLSLVVELFPQTRLGNRDVDEVQIQLRHGSPDLDQMLSARIWVALQECINEAAEAK
jgi:hypothetical protein